MGGGQQDTVSKRKIIGSWEESKYKALINTLLYRGTLQALTLAWFQGFSSSLFPS